MSYTLDWRNDGVEDLRITLTGPASTDDLVAAIIEAEADPQYRTSLRVLLDERRVDWDGITRAEIERRAELAVAALRSESTHRVATVVDRKLAYGLMRMMQALWDGRLGIEETIFYDLEAARAWLAESPG